MYVLVITGIRQDNNILLFFISYFYFIFHIFFCRNLNIYLVAFERYCNLLHMDRELH